MRRARGKRGPVWREADDGLSKAAAETWSLSLDAARCDEEPTVAVRAGSQSNFYW